MAQASDGNDTQYRSTAFEFEWAGLLAFWQRDSRQQLSVRFIPDSEEGRTADLRIGDLVDVECKRLTHTTAAASSLRARAQRTVNEARAQLPKDRPSIICLDLYEPLLALDEDIRERERRDINDALIDLMRGHGRPTGILYNAPEPGDFDRAGRKGVYNGNKTPTVPFPPDFELFPGFYPVESETL